MARRKVSLSDKKPDSSFSSDPAELTTEIFGSEIPKNTDGTPLMEGEVEVTQAKRAGALDTESVARNRREARNVTKVRQGQTVRWNEDDARLLFETVKKAFPTGIKIYVKQIEPSQEDFRPIEMSSLKDAVAFYDYVQRFYHKSRGAAKYQCTFRDSQDRARGFLNMPDTTGEESRLDMGGRDNGGHGPPPGFPGGMPYLPPYGYGGYPPPGYGAPPGYPPPQGYYPPPQGPYGQQSPPQYPPQQTQATQAPPPPAPSPPQAEVTYVPPQQNVVPPQPSTQPFTPPWAQQPQPPYGYPPQPVPRDTAVEDKMATMFWQFQQMQERNNQQQLQLERVLGSLDVRDRQIADLVRGQGMAPQFQPPQPPPPPAAAAPPPAPPPYSAPPGYGGGGFAHMAPGLGAPPPAVGFPGPFPGAGAPPPAYPPQNPYAQPDPYAVPYGQQPPPGYPGYPPQPNGPGCPGYPPPQAYPPPAPSGYPQGYPPPPAQEPARGTGNPLADIQRTVGTAMETIGSLTRTLDDFKRTMSGASETEEPEMGMAPLGSPDKPAPFEVMPLGAGNDAIQYAYNPHDGSPNFLGIALANGPRIGEWVKSIGNTVARFQAAQAAEQARQQGQPPGTITVQPEPPQMQQMQAPQQPIQQAPVPAPQANRGMPPLTSMMRAMGGGG